MTVPPVGKSIETFAVIDDYGDQWKIGSIIFNGDTLQEAEDWAENENFHSASIVLMDGENA